MFPETVMLLLLLLVDYKHTMFIIFSTENQWNSWKTENVIYGSFSLWNMFNLTIARNQIAKAEQF